MDDVSRAGTVEPFGRQAELGFGLLGVAGRDRFVNLADLGADGPLDGTVPSPVGDVLPKPLLGTLGSRHGIGSFRFLFEVLCVVHTRVLFVFSEC